MRHSASIILFHNYFSLAVSTRTAYISLYAEQSTASFITIFHKYCFSYKVLGYYNKFDSMKSVGVYYWYVKMTRCGCVRHGIGYFSYYVKKTYSALGCLYCPLCRPTATFFAGTYYKACHHGGRYWVYHHGALYLKSSHYSPQVSFTGARASKKVAMLWYDELTIWEVTMIATLIASFMGPTSGPPGADRTQVGPMLAPWILLSGSTCRVTYPVL